MVDMTAWLIAHAVAILAHFAMLVASIAAFSSAAQSSVEDDSFGYSSRSNAPLGPWASSGVAGFALLFNIFLFVALWFLQRPSTTTEQSRQRKRNAALWVSMIMGVVIIVGDVFAAGLNAKSSSESSAKGALIAACALSVIAAIVSVVTFVLDIKKLRSNKNESYELTEAIKYQA